VSDERHERGILVFFPENCPRGSRLAEAAADAERAPLRALRRERPVAVAVVAAPRAAAR